MSRTNKLVQAFNSGELSPKLDSRIDQEKYQMGCRTLENAYPLIEGGAERRPGTKFIASQKTQTAKARVVGFEHSVDDVYILEFENQNIRVFKDDAQVTTGTGTEVDATYAAAGTVISHWKMNDNTANTVVADTGSHDGVASGNTSELHSKGKVGTGCLDLDGQHAIALDTDFNFIEGTNGDFTINGWVRVTETGLEQVIMSKWDETTGSQAREWKLVLDETNRLKMILADESLLLDSDLIAHWKMNDSANNSTVADETGNHNGTMDDEGDNYTSTHSVDGKIANAIEFDGTNDSINCGEVDLSGKPEFSFCCWVNLKNIDKIQQLIDKQAFGSTYPEYFIQITAANKIKFSFFTGNGAGDEKDLTSDTALEADTWYFISAVKSATGLKIYLNAVEDGSNAETGTVWDGSAPTFLGRIGGSGSRLDGKLDNVMIFDKELSQADVTALYNSTNGTEDLNTQYISTITDNAIATGWRYIAMTYEGEHASWTGATAADYIKLYVDSELVDTTATNLANYVKMEDTGAIARIGAQESSAGATEKFFGSRIDNLAIFSDTLSAVDVASLYSSTSAYELETPYLTADLPALDIKQSADVMYIAHPDYEPRKLSRYSDDDWTLEVTDIQDGPFLSQNSVVESTIAASATTGTVTLTASGHAPFISGTTAGHAPSGSVATSKSQTGTLFKLVHALDTPSVDAELTTNVLDEATDPLEVYKGVTWDLTTNGTWGVAGNSASVVLERSYDGGTTFETVVTATSAANKNITTDGTEEVGDAIYRVRVSEVGGDASKCSVQLSVRDTDHIGIVKITSVTSPTVAIGTVLTTIGSTDATHRWSEGAWSNYRGWPRTVDISPEERLTFSGSTAKPLTSWGSVIGEFDSFKAGILDDDAITFTLIGSGQQNTIQWVVPRTSLMIGTVGGEHLLGASAADEALTPTNVTAKIKGTRGSERLQAMLVNNSIIFLQRGGRRVRELSNIDTYDAENYRAEDLTVFSNHITKSGIVDWAYQRTPDPMLWCVRDDGEIAVMTYERQQEVFSWARVVLAGTDAKAESVTVIYGGAGNEDEVWFTVSRTINGSTVRNIEKFKPRDWGSDIKDAFFVDSGITDTGGTTTISGLDHLEGETVQVFADGVEQYEAATDDFKVSNGDITVASGLTTVQAGLGYTTTVKPMKIDLGGLGLATKKKVTEGTLAFYKTIGGKWGNSTDNMYDFDYKNADVADGTLYSGHLVVPFDGGYTEGGDVIVQQDEPLPMTLLSLTLDVGAHNF